MSLKKKLIFITVFLIACICIYIAGDFLVEFLEATNQPLIEIYHSPTKFSRRHGHFTANICGSISKQAKEVKYQLNGGDWIEVRNQSPRVPPPLFTIEMTSDELKNGPNTVMIEANSIFGKKKSIRLDFHYDSSPIQLPVKVEWIDTNLDVQDGYWETFCSDSGWRVRPKPGFEGYDRILAVTGSFPVGRRVKTDLVLRYKIGEPDWDYGFGILPMWGGRPDTKDYSPRRGWNFSIAWWFARFKALGMEFSYKFGDSPAQWVGTYRKFIPQYNTRYFLICESWSVKDDDGKHLYYRQRMKWWTEGNPEPEEWMELKDIEGAPLPPGEYAVALIAYHCQVDYGPVIIEPLDR